ncbi:MAG: hypothetical protein A3I61_20070 [Acidobacteria bacterium RIFCSPLOWO2_02_FULL_68_18]|nr:MAG: hypothetical protein A3I61_20070 [Acidobacteria bacterium RIFCSPLOWO2_02_FULL_68_18]OFW48242.1 MAG: hypothetical protein A3G77_03070 [Acidobacteria bacterium RIFCSPLOWO2_12_FULL_68_19]
MLSEVLPEGATRYYSLARWALVDALRASGVGPGDPVLVPGLVCREVLAAISVLGASPAFYHVTSQLGAVLAADGGRSAKAVVAVNYFGFPQELDTFRQYCARTGAALIEDNAHGLLSRDESGQWLGSRGDAGVFSFRKTIAVPGGGALVLRRRQEMPPAAPVRPVRRVLLRHHTKQACRRVAGRLGPVRAAAAISAIRRVRQSFVPESTGSSHRDDETRIPIAPDPPAFVSRHITAADPALESERRRALYGLASRILEAADAVPVYPRLPPHVVPYGYPVFAAPSRVPDITARLARHGLPLLRWPDLPEAVASAAPEHYRHLMVVPFLW